MDNYNSYDNFENWDTLTEPTPIDNRSESTLGASDVESADNLRKSKKYRTPILTVQLTISLLVLLFIFLSKIFATDLYREIISWYNSELSTSMYLSGDLSDLDYSDFFLIATDDEI